MDTLKLYHPILVNNKTYKELTYDPEKITADDFCVASAKAAEKNLSIAEMSSAAIAETNTTLHLYLGFMAIIAANPEIDFADLEVGIQGVDVFNIMQIGRNFINGGYVDSSPETSESTAESTAPSSTSASKKSAKSGD